VRVLILLPSVISGGAERFNLDLAVALNRNGIEADIFAWAMSRKSVEPSFLASLGQAGVHVIGGRPARVKMRYEAPEIIARLMLSSRRYDVLIGGLELTSTLLAAGAANALRKPVIGEVQTFLDYVLPRTTSTVRMLAKAMYPRLDALVGVSEDVVREARSLHLAPRRCLVIGNGIDVERVLRASRAEAVSNGLHVKEGTNIVAVGRMVDFKGFDLLVGAHAKVLRHGLKHNLILVGDGPDRPLLERLARDLGVDETVVFRGFNPNPYEILANADLFCLPSRRESFGVVLLEALALGVPIVATACSAGPRWILDEGRYGDLVEPNSVNALADAIGRHLEGSTSLRAKAMLGERRAQDFAIDTIAAEYARLLSELLEGHRGIRRHHVS
jgi:glycosyltransferase involved in cell wall biosynthesis